MMDKCGFAHGAHELSNSAQGAQQNPFGIMGQQQQNPFGMGGQMGMNMGFMGPMPGFNPGYGFPQPYGGGGGGYGGGMGMDKKPVMQALVKTKMCKTWVLFS